MKMKEYLIDTFKFNDSTNRDLIEKIKLLADKKECVRLFSHLINCQYKWMARIEQDPAVKNMSWWEPVYETEEIEKEWCKSLQLWINYINKRTDEELSADVIFHGLDDGLWAASPKDIALQLNYHSIHHRAQIQMLIRQQGIEPDFVDYIGTKYRRVE